MRSLKGVTWLNKCDPNLLGLIWSLRTISHHQPHRYNPVGLTSHFTQVPHQALILLLTISSISPLGKDEESNGDY